MSGDNNAFKLVCATLHKLNLDKYEQSFRDNEMTDEVVKACLTDEKMLPFLKPLIPKLGQQVMFAREFLAHSDTTKLPEEKLLEEPILGCGVKVNSDQVQDHVAATKVVVEVASEPFAAKVEEKQDVFREKKWNLAQAKAVHIFKSVFTEDIEDREDYLDDAELKQLLKEGREAGKKALQKSAPEKPSKEELEAQMNLLQTSLDEEYKKFRDLNQKKQQDMIEKYEAKIDVICQDLLQRIKLQSKNAPTNLDEILQIAWVEAGIITEEYHRELKSWKCYDEDKLVAKIEENMTRLILDIKGDNQLHKSKVFELFTKAVRKHEEEIHRTKLKNKKSGYLRLKKLITSEMRHILEAENMDEQSKAICMKEFENVKGFFEYSVSSMTEADRAVAGLCAEINQRALEAYDAKWDEKSRNNMTLDEATLRNYHKVCKQVAMEAHRQASDAGRILLGMSILELAHLWATAERIMDGKFKAHQESKKKKNSK